eukprot:7788196-Lingulodinium_polyedra.AAC.1
MASPWTVRGQFTSSFTSNSWPVRGQPMASAWPVHEQFDKQFMADSWPMHGQLGPPPCKGHRGRP